MPTLLMPTCNTCLECGCTCEQAREHFSHLTTLSLSNGGSHGGGNDVLHEADLCAQFSDPRPANPLPGFAFGGGSVQIGASDCTQQVSQYSCAPVGTTYGWNALFSRCRVEQGVRNFDWVGLYHAPNNSFACGGKPIICSKTASIVFSCDESGNKQYHLRVSAEVYLSAGSLFFSQNFTPDPSWPDLLPPGPGSDWTATVANGSYTAIRNGSTFDDGASVLYSSEFAIPSNGNQPFRLFYGAATWKKNASSVSMWSPSPSIDPSGITESATATVS